LDREVAALRAALSDRTDLEARARYVVERMALALQASILLRAGKAEVADAFCASRLDGARGLAFGTLPAGTPFSALIERALPSEGID
jgi:putative acyl-CoA dehydrogenase